jgi:hypothetical protein
LRNNLFFFGSFNPTVRREIVTGVRGNEADFGAGNGDVVNSGLFLQRGEFARRYRTYNYAGKLDWVMNSNHQVTFSIFGDPTETNLSSFAFLNIDNNTADSVRIRYAQLGGSLQRLTLADVDTKLLVQPGSQHV